MNKVKISAVLISKDAENTISKVLDSLTWVDEIIILDSGSSDNTINIAKNYTSNIFRNNFLGFGNQKNLANTYAKNDWILSVDTDEVLSNELITELKHLDLGNTNYTVFNIPRTLYFLGKKLRFSGEYKKPIVRLFNKKSAHWNTENVHETLIFNGSIGVLRGELIHYSYVSIEDFFLKINKYTTLGAKQSKIKNIKQSKLMVGVKFLFTFFKVYIFKRGIFDGYQGFVWSLFAAISSAIKNIKIIEAGRLETK